MKALALLLLRWQTHEDCESRASGRPLPNEPYHAWPGPIVVAHTHRSEGVNECG
jgi:hypothetical protein